jgi:exonuclease SbcC
MTVRIAHIGLRNLRSYRSAELDLGPGTTLLTGDIGSGKTSLLYAVEMALFGFAEVDPGYLIRHGARDATVSLTLTDGTHRWELRRRFVRKARKGRETFEPTENSLAVDGQRASYSATELRRRTIELLGFPDNPNPRAHSDVFRWAIYLAQERMRDVLDPDADARMETVRKALGVEEFRLAGENAKGLARALTDRATLLTEQADRHRGLEQEAIGWKEAQSSARREIVTLGTREQRLREELAAARAVLERAERRRRELEAVREAAAQAERLAHELGRAVEQEQEAVRLGQELLDRLQRDRARESAPLEPATAPTARLDELRRRRVEMVQQLGDLERLRGEATVLAEQIDQALVREREVEDRVTKLEHELLGARTDLERWNASAPVVEPAAPSGHSLAQLERERTRREATRRELDRRLATAAAELQELADLVREGVCPRCHRPVGPDEFESHRQESAMRVAGLRKELEEASRRTDEASALIDARVAYDREHDRWKFLEARRADSRQKEAQLRSRLEAERERAAQMGTERVRLESRQRALADRLVPHNGIRAELASIDRAIVAAEELDRVAVARRERLAEIDRRLPELKAEIDAHQRNLEERSREHLEVLRKIQEDQSRIVRPDEIEAAVSTGRRRVEELDQSLQSVLREASGPHAQLAQAEAALTEVTRRQVERDALDATAGHLRALARWVDEPFRAAMLELERRRLQHGRLQFERHFAQYFAALVEDPALSARVDERFAPWADIGGEPTPAEALSGGERTALALAYRLALGRTVRDAGRLTLETLILDEPTEGFSQEQTLRMGDLLEQLGLPQVILVSHERQLEGFADRVVRIHKRGGLSSVEEPNGATTDAEAGPEVGSPPEPVRAPRVRSRKIRRLTDLESAEAGDGPGQVR